MHISVHKAVIFILFVLVVFNCVQREHPGAKVVVPLVACYLKETAGAFHVLSMICIADGMSNARVYEDLVCTR